MPLNHTNHRHYLLTDLCHAAVREIGPSSFFIVIHIVAVEGDRHLYTNDLGWIEKYHAAKTIGT